MAREYWTDRDDGRRDDGRRDDDHVRREREDYGQADYSTDYAYDPERRAGYRTDSRYVRDDYERRDAEDRDYARRMDDGDYRRGERRDEGRSWADRASGFFGGASRRTEDRRRRRGPSDRVLWAVISERLEDERRLDLSDVDVIVENGEVTLNGTVRRKEDKRRIEDIADIDGVDHVQNNLRVRHPDRGWTFI